MKIMATKKEFKAFVNLQTEGVINMNDIKTGCILSGLSEEIYKDIMKNYSKYSSKYNLK